MLNPTLSLVALSLLCGSATAMAAPAAMRPGRADIRDLSPLPRPVINVSEDEAPRNSRTEKAITSTAAGSATARAPAPVPAAPATGNVSYATRSEKSLPEKLWDGFAVSYTALLNGPSLGYEQGATYNVFYPGKDAMYFYHSLDATLNPGTYKHQLGMNISLKQTLVDGVEFGPGLDPSKADTAWQDPQFWYRYNGLFDTDYFSTDVQLSYWPSMTNYSREEMMAYFSAGFDTTWNIKLRREWTAYVSTRLKPTYYAEPQAAYPYSYNREWLYMSAGAFVGYQFTPSWQLTAAATFDSNLYANFDWFLNHGDSNADRAQLELNFYGLRFARIGAYTTVVVTNPTLESTIVGGEIQFNLLRSRL